MGKFEDLYESIMIEGKEDAPNYRKAEQKDGMKEPVCSACIHNQDGECKKFEFIFDRGYTCDDFEAHL